MDSEIRESLENSIAEGIETSPEIQERAVSCAVEANLGDVLITLMTSYYRQIGPNNKKPITSDDMWTTPLSISEKLIISTMTHRQHHPNDLALFPPPLKSLLPFVSLAYIKHHADLVLSIPKSLLDSLDDLSGMEFAVYHSPNEISITKFMEFASKIITSTNHSANGYHHSNDAGAGGGGDGYVGAGVVEDEVGFVYWDVNGVMGENGVVALTEDKPRDTVEEAREAISRVSTWLPLAFTKGVIPFHTYLRIACPYLPGTAISDALSDLAPGAKDKARLPHSVLLDVYPACLQLAGMWPIHGRILYPWAAYLVMQFTDITDDIRNTIKSHTTSISGQDLPASPAGVETPDFLPPIEDCLNILRVVGDPSIENFNNINSSSRFKDYQSIVLRSVIDMKHPVKCVYVLMCTGSFNLLMDILLKIVGFDDVTLDLIEELTRCITTDILTKPNYCSSKGYSAVPSTSIISSFTSATSSSSSATSSATASSSSSIVNGTSTEGDAHTHPPLPVPLKEMSREAQRELLDYVPSSSIPLTLRTRIQFSLRDRSSFVRQVFRLLITLCDLWQYRVGGDDVGAAQSGVEGGSMRIRLRDKTSVLVSAIARAGCNDELLCAILNTATDFNATTYRQLETISTHTSQILDAAHRHISFQIGNIPMECVSSLACLTLSYQHQIRNIREILEVLPDANWPASTYILHILEAPCYYTPELDSVTPAPDSPTIGSNAGSSSSSGMGSGSAGKMKSKKGMLWLPKGPALALAMTLLGDAIQNAPPVGDRSIWAGTTGAECVEYLLLKRMSDIPRSNPFPLAENSLYLLASRLEIIDPAMDYVKSLFKFSKSTNLETLLTILASAAGRKGADHVASIACGIIQQALRVPTTEYRVVLRLLFTFPLKNGTTVGTGTGAIPGTGPGSTPTCPFNAAQCTELLGIILGSKVKLIRSLSEYNPAVPFLSANLLVRNASIMTAITVGLPVSSDRLVPQDYVSLVPLWCDLAATQDPSFLNLLILLGDQVVSRLTNERVTAKIKESFAAFFKHLSRSCKKNFSVATKWSAFMARTNKALKTKKTIHSILAGY